MKPVRRLVHQAWGRQRVLFYRSENGICRENRCGAPTNRLEENLEIYKENYLLV